jgi:FKBP-type peptidyl-prolyl cis-trans isomerase FkpA
MIIRSLLSALLLITLSCGSPRVKDNGSSQPGKTEIEDLNRYFIQKDRERIQNYIERKGLVMKETSTGLWYQIISEGEGTLLTDNSKLVMNFECSLLDGEICYSSELAGPKEIILGRSEIEAGLDQGLRLLKPGGTAIFILPPFLAYGFRGDGKKIPSRAVLVYNISILWPVN